MAIYSPEVENLLHIYCDIFDLLVESLDEVIAKWKSTLPELRNSLNDLSFSELFADEEAFDDTHELSPTIHNEQLNKVRSLLAYAKEAYVPEYREEFQLFYELFSCLYSHIRRPEGTINNFIDDIESLLERIEEQFAVFGY